VHGTAIFGRFNCDGNRQFSLFAIFVTIAIAWIAYHPQLADGLLAVAICLIAMRFIPHRNVNLAAT
jgi:hypothetical protein